jgi:hypothetical protein
LEALWGCGSMPVVAQCPSGLQRGQKIDALIVVCRDIVRGTVFSHACRAHVGHELRPAVASR